MEKEKDIFTRQWIIDNSLNVLEEYSDGITLRQLYYRLVALGMINDTNHYKRVVGAMGKARWDNTIPMEAFIDRERTMYGKTKFAEKDIESEIERAKQQIKAWMVAYGLNRWSNQETYIEVWIEKKALQGVFEMPCLLWGVGLAPCKGYPSITFLNDARERFENAYNTDKNLKILYFGDHDPSGEDIPRSIKDNLYRMGVDVEVERIALNKEQIKKMKLPGVPPKKTDTRTKDWAGGNVVECDAVEPKTLAKMCENAIRNNFDEDLYCELEEKEEEERETYKAVLKDFVENIE